LKFRIYRINTPGLFDQLNYKLSQDVTVGSKPVDSSSNSEIETPNPHKLNLGSITPQIQTPGGTAALGTTSFFPILAGLALFLLDLKPVLHVYYVYHVDRIGIVLPKYALTWGLYR